MIRPFILFSVLALTIFACNKSSQKDVNTRKPGNREMADLNSYFVQKDRERIKSYGERKNIVLKESGSGLWYNIIKTGTGDLFKEKDHVVMEYKCSLLDGTLCYSSEKTGPKEVVLGRSELEAGLNEGLRMVGRGGEAIFILPPFLAFGLLGDNKAIPPRATLVYEIKIIDK